MPVRIPPRRACGVTRRPCFRREILRHESLPANLFDPVASLHPVSATGTNRSLSVEFRKLSEGLARREKLDAAWRKLEFLTETCLGLGFLLLGTAVPMFAGGSTSLTWTSLLQFVPAAGLLFLGIVFLETAVAVKGHFIDDEQTIDRFLAIFDDSAPGSPAERFEEWASNPTLRGKAIVRQLKRAIAAVRLGLIMAVLLALTFLGVDLLVVYLVLNHGLGPVWGSVALATAILAYAMMTWGFIHRRKRLAQA